jgi:signal transduction histidine kinase
VKSIYDRELPLINGDMAQLKQLFLNLFMNALAAMQPGGQLSVRLTANENPGGSALVVEIRDTGAGIPDELLEKIFDPFVTTKPGGSGLGLSICRQITDAHHATIRIQKNKDIQGTTVVLEFPAAHDMPAATQIAHYVHNTSEE